MVGAVRSQVELRCCPVDLEMGRGVRQVNVFTKEGRREESQYQM